MAKLYIAPSEGDSVAKMATMLSEAVKDLAKQIEDPLVVPVIHYSTEEPEAPATTWSPPVYVVPVNKYLSDYCY